MSDTSLESSRRERLETSVETAPLRGQNAASGRRELANHLDMLLRLDPEHLTPEQITWIGKRIRDLKSCRETTFLARHIDDGTATLSTPVCRSRICPQCARQRSFDVIRRIKHVVKEYDAPRFLTLTLRATDENLKTQLKKLTHSFRRLRQRKRYKKAITAGIFVLEITYNPTESQWHPHLHIIFDGDYIPQAQIALDWKEITCGSYIVDIRKVVSRNNSAAYLAKYVAKSAETSGLPTHKLLEWAQNLHGMRTVQTFGSSHGQLPPERDDSTYRKREIVASVQAIYELALMKFKNAPQIWARLRALGRKEDTTPDATLCDETAALMEAFFEKKRADYREAHFGIPITKAKPPPDPFLWEEIT